MVCPRCASASVSLKPRKNRRVYRHYSILALVLEYVDGWTEDSRHREDGTPCVCLDCGYEWYPKKEERLKRYAKILSKHLGPQYFLISVDSLDGVRLRLGEKDLQMCYSENDIRRIPYDEIVSVEYRDSLGPLYGWLSIRDRWHKHKRFPKNFAEAKKDKTTVFCPFGDENLYKLICRVLIIIAKENRKAGLL